MCNCPKCQIKRKQVESKEVEITKEYECESKKSLKNFWPPFAVVREERNSVHHRGRVLGVRHRWHLVYKVRTGSALGAVLVFQGFVQSCWGRKQAGRDCAGDDERLSCGRGEIATGSLAEVPGKGDADVPKGQGKDRGVRQGLYCGSEKSVPL